MSLLQQDFKYAARTLLRSPGYTAVALISLGLGIGANTAIFTLTNAVFLHGLPVKDPAQLIQVYQVDHATKTTNANLVRTAVSYLNFLDYRDQSDVFSGMAGFTGAGVTMTGYGKPQQQAATVVTANYFDVLGVTPMAGRTFLPDEDRKPGGNAVAVISYSLWLRLFGGNRDAIGRTLNLNSVAYTIVGVAPPEFKGTFTIGAAEVIWLPISMHSQVLAGPTEAFFNSRRFRFFNVFGRLKPGKTEQQALAQLKTIASRLESAYPKDNQGRTVETASLADAALGFLPRDQTMGAAIALSSAVGFVLLIACANIANLSLARATKRERELGIRTALGAARGRIIRQLLTESVLLALAGGALGIGIGWLGSRALWAFRPPFLGQNSVDIRLDLRVVLFTAGVSLLTGILFGLAPAFRASRPDIAQILNSGGRGNIQGGAKSLMRASLVVCEIALAMIALAGAGLFVRSMQHAQQVDLGFETRNLFAFAFDVASQKMTPDRGRQFMRQAVEKASAAPGVAAAAIASNGPMVGGLLLTVLREGDSPDPRNGVLALSTAISPAYFDTMRIPLVEGRNFNSYDRQGSNPVAIVNQAMAQYCWPGQSAIGKRYRFATGTELYEVVGVTKNVVTAQVGEKPQLVSYRPFEQQYQSVAVMHVRTTTAPQQVVPAVLGVVQPLSPDMALRNPVTIETLIGNALWAPRMGAALFTIFGVLAMVLAAVGVYGVMAYMVLQRTNEIGIRMAMGAPPASVLRMMVGQSMRLALIGIVAGSGIALALTRYITNLLLDVSPADPLTFSAVVGLLAITALAAGSIPALRAARIDPVDALRQE